MMPRRGSSGIQALVLVAFVLLFVYGYYSFNELKNSLKKSEETAKRIKLQEENVSAQLQAISEQKNQLEESIKHDKESFQAEKDGFVRDKADLESKFKAEKAELGERISSLSEELQKIKLGYEALKDQQHKRDELDSAHAAERVKLTSENKLLKQENINRIAEFKNEIADLKRQNDVLRLQLRKLAGKSEHTTTEPKKDTNKAVGVGALPSDDHKPPVNQDNNQLRQLNHDPKPNGEGNNLEEKMQINGPLDNKRQAYFEPIEAKPDHPIKPIVDPVHADHVVDARDQQLPHADQVIPPHLDDADNHKKGDDVRKNPDAALGDDEEKLNSIKRGVMARPNSNLFAHPLNPVQKRDEEPPQEMDLQLRHNAVGVEADRGRARSRGGNDVPIVADHQIEKQQQAREHRRNVEEDQLQGPAMHEQNGNDRDDAADADEDDDYHYEDNKHKAADKEAVDGPHAAPVDEDDENKDGGL